MSKENEKTLEVYQKTAYMYLSNSDTHDRMDLAKAEKKRKKIENLIQESFSKLPANSKIFEIGAGNGANAEIMQKMGFDVTASDTADDFINATKTRCSKVIKFDALKDEFPDQYNGIFCWRVFVHFTKEDAQCVLQKAYDSLQDGGIFIFNAINRDLKDVDNEWVDFEGEYHMGVERYYSYFSESDMNQIINKTNFKIKDFHKEGGDNNDKWLVYVLEK